MMCFECHTLSCAACVPVGTCLGCSGAWWVGRRNGRAPVAAIDALLDKLRVQCSNEPQCTWSGTRGEYRARHHLACEYRRVECGMCSSRLPSCELAAHAEQCPNREFGCECGALIREAQRASHEHQCHNYSQATLFRRMHRLERALQLLEREHPRLPELLAEVDEEATRRAWHESANDAAFAVERVLRVPSSSSSFRRATAFALLQPQLPSGRSRLVIAEALHARLKVVELKSENREVKQIAIPRARQSPLVVVPTALAVSPRGDRIAIVDTNSSRVIVVDGEEPTTVVAEIPGNEHNNGEHQVVGCTTAAFNNRGHLLVGHPFGVSEFTSDGAFVQQLVSSTSSAIRPIAVDRSDMVYVANKQDIACYTRDGQRARIITPTASKTSTTSTSTATMTSTSTSTDEQPLVAQIGGIAIDNEGRIYITDMHRHRVLVLSNQGQVLGTLGSVCGAAEGQFDTPSSIVVDPEGTMVIVGDMYRPRWFGSDGTRMQCIRLPKHWSY